MPRIDLITHVGEGRYATFTCPYPLERADLEDLKATLEIQMRLLERTAIEPNPKEPK